MTASLIPRAFIDSTHWEMFRAVGANELGLEEPTSVPSGPGMFQFWASHPGSPLLRWTGEGGGEGQVEAGRGWGVGGWGVGVEKQRGDGPSHR